MSNDPVGNHFKVSLDALAVAANDASLLALTREIAATITTALRDGRKVLLIGNGGSAADAQHIAAELVGRYKEERPGWAAIALTTDTSALTAIGNDYGIEQIFARQVEGLGQRGDILIAMSTSGRSPNIVAAIERARGMGITTIGFTGAKGSSMTAHCDRVFVAPTDDTPVVQQIHMTALHAICDQVERALTAGT
ncbi:MAG: sugar isomerase [Proteobacteria bacterium SG_bin9]|nr:MAG: sugar isomerase [Proteobacteria bacterium SG_bin9]